eukprot:TRINITY_DN29287_c0_g1_i1.p2 TRINITY_DN29287_c0_g1~~TRINITY_DN29287_c0_g1_i1.p2  ORF type:complete len:103 (-),score=31.43 TRINITY_DN29287_c0_g1_i1:119-427(-)
MAAARRSSLLIVLAVCIAAFCTLQMAFVAPPKTAQTSLRGADVDVSAAVPVAALGLAAGAMPEAAFAANQGYALLQLGWAVFIISLGPAVLFYIYFNKPELL